MGSPIAAFKQHLAFVLGVILLVCAMPLSATDFYAAPGGTPGGDGSITNPWDLQTALSQPSSVRPGDTIWLRGGTYIGGFVSNLTGTPDSPIIVRQFPGERATLDLATPDADLNTGLHNLDVEGPYAWFWGFEVTNSSTTRQASNVYQTWRGDGVWVTGADTKFINLIVHDTDQGFSFWEPAVDSDIYGSLIYNNGWVDPSRGRGHGVYMQNLNGTKRLLDNLLFAGFQYGFQAYGSDQANLDNFYLEGNMAAFSGILQGSYARDILIGGHSVAQNPVLVSNYTYVDGNGGDNDLGYAAGCTSPVVTNNYMGGGLRFVTCSNVTMTGNTFYGLVDFVGTTFGQSLSSFPNNSYYPTTLPPGEKVFVRPNQYEAGRANIAIFNWDHANTVTADISGIGLQTGDSYELHNAEDYYGDVINGVWDGGLLQIPMTGHTVATPVGWTPAPTTFPEFGMFVVQKTSGTGGTAPPVVPVISPGSSTFTGSLTVTLSTGTPGATIRYTTDGSAPGPSSTLYQGSFTVSSTTKVEAQAFLTGTAPSGIASATFTQNAAATPGISPGGGGFTGSATVVLTTTTPVAVIHYTLDGSAPNASSPVYSSPIVLTVNTVVRAQVSASGMANSSIASATFIISAAPTNPPPAGVPMAGLNMWLRADAGITAVGSTVSQWVDQSGSGTTAVQAVSANQPSLINSAINGLPAIRFDGTLSYMTFVLPLNNLTGMTVLMVSGRLPDVDGAWNGVANAPLFWDELASWCSTNFSPFRSVVKYRFGTGQSGNLPSYTRPQPLGPNDYTLTTALKNGGTEQLFVGGQLVLTQTGKIPTIEGVVDTGTLGRGMLSYYQGDIAEVLVYNRALSDAERQQAEAYLLSKYLGVSVPTIAPNSGVAGTSVAVTLTGTNLSGATLNSGSGLTANSVVTSATQITANLVIAANATTGPQNITVTTAGGTSSAVVFTINPPSPTLATIAPTSGVVGTTVSVTLTGTNLSGATLNLGSGLTANSVVTSATQITANLVIAANAVTGPQNITVTTAGGTSSAVVFTINPPPPTLATIAPTSGVVGTTVAVTLTGTNLSGATLNLGSGLTANSVVTSATQITANLVIAANAAVGPQNITVSTAGGTSNAVVFTSNAASSPPPVNGVTIWPSSAVPAVPANTDTRAVELGVKFRSDVAGNVTGIRFYKGTLNTGTHTGQLWSSTGTLLAQGVFSGETASGWQQVNFSVPVAIAANTTYVAAYHTTSGGYSSDLNYFTAAGVDNPPLHALRSGVDGSNGVYMYTATPGFPSLTYNATNYWVDVVFSTTSSAPTLATIAPTSGVVGTTVAVTLTGTNLSGATLNLGSGLTANSVVTSATQITANLVITANAVTGPQNITVATAGGTSSAVVFTINPPPPTLATIAPTSGVVGTTVAVTLTGTNLSGATLNLGSGLTANSVVTSATQITANLVIAANAAVGPQNITVSTAGGTSNAVVFTSNAASSPPPVNGVTIWPSSAVPAVPANTDTRAVELGVKFRSDVAGNVTGIRFYKGTLNTGTHTGQLWSSTGTLLAQGVFSGETASGWQQVNFSVPVAIAANTTYVAAYHTTSGGYSSDLNYFTAAGVDNPPLHALRSGVDGSNGVYMYTATPGFPSLTYNATNYWVDVVFSTTSSAPTLATIAPTSGVVGTTVAVTLTGTNLSGATLNLGSGLTANSVVTSATQITANLVITANAVTGPQNITVATAGGTSSAVVFTINPPPPTLATIAPTSGVVGTTVAVTLTGTNLSGATLNLGSGLTANSVVTSATQITANLVIAANAAVGPQNITVSTAGGTSNAVVFTSNAASSPPPVNGVTIWPSSAVPAVPANTDTRAVELGVKFRSDVAGNVTGIRFYKGTLNTGTHTGQLWSSTGTLLAQGVFSGETASGWQQLNFAAPLAIAANTTYVAAYHTTSGGYSSDLNYFTAAGVDNPPLHALRFGVDGSNGVYMYTATPGFPSLSYNASNYWVDVVFSPTVP